MHVTSRFKFQKLKTYVYNFKHLIIKNKNVNFHCWSYIFETANTSSKLKLLERLNKILK